MQIRFDHRKKIFKYSDKKKKMDPDLQHHGKKVLCLGVFTVQCSVIRKLSTDKDIA